MTVDDFIWTLLRAVCKKHDVKPGQFFGGSKRSAKGRAAVQARMEFVRTMRAEVVWFDRELCLRNEVNVADLPNCTPIGTPLLGDIMGLDHSTIVAMIGRQREAQGTGGLGNLA